MALQREIFKALEAVVGKRNISEDYGVLETYRCAAAQSSAHYGPYDHRTPMPQAVLMPGSTEEVQAIIRICNKYKLQYKASTTFWSSHGYISSDFAIQLDMRRMKKIVIDPKNMVAIIEPYVIGATLQAEAMKYGLVCNIPGVGCSSSTLASTSGWTGPGPSSIFTGNNHENMLCVEWVLPTGEIAVTGTAGTGEGWFCGEGPGPSLRGMFKGSTGQTGELGVCTRLSVKLSPWPGPEYLPTSGTIPAYKAELSDNFRAYTLCFPSWQAWADAVMKINDNNILYVGHRQFSMFGREIKSAMLRILTDPDKQLCDIPVLNETQEIKKESESMKIEVHVVVAGLTKRDMEWKEEALDSILSEFGGWKDEMMLEPEMEKWLLAYLIRLGHKNLNYVLCGSYEGCFGLSGNNMVESALTVEEASELKRKAELEWTYLASVGGDAFMGSIGGIGGGGGPMGWEMFAHFDAHDKSSIEGTRKFFTEVCAPWSMEVKKFGMEMSKITEKMRRPDGYAYTQDEMNEMYKNIPGTNIFAYQWKLREAFNPNRLCGSYYQAVDPAVLKQG